MWQQLVVAVMACAGCVTAVHASDEKGRDPKRHYTISQVPQTGQTSSILPGDDGDWQAGLEWPTPRFVVNVSKREDRNHNRVCDGNEICDGSVTDRLTNLVWLQNSTCFGEREWAEGIGDANELAGDGTSNCGLTDNSHRGDWRMANLKELLSLMDYGHDFPEPLLPDGNPFTGVKVISDDGFYPASYWTSTSSGPASGGVYTISFGTGWVERYSVDPSFALFSVWPVRDWRRH